MQREAGVRARLAVLALLSLVAASAAHANGTGGGGPSTAFERFVLSACTPCVQDTYTVASLAVPAVPLPAALARPGTTTSRAGEIAIEVLRARQLGRRDWPSLALRVTLSVTTQAAQPFRVAIGLLDGAEVRALSLAVAEMARIAAGPSSGNAETTDVDFHGGSLRIGLLRVRADRVAYVQAGDLAPLLQRPVWDVPATLYLPVTDLPALAEALARAASTIEAVRGE